MVQYSRNQLHEKFKKGKEISKLLAQLLEFGYTCRNTERTKYMTYEKLIEEVRKANLVLVGLGEKLSADMESFYQSLAALLEEKDYFIVSLSDNRRALESVGLFSDRITVPLTERETQESWEKYLHWLSFTLNQNLCILELGVAFVHPEIIRFPFEKTCYFNQKSKYIRIHENFPQLSKEIAARGISVQEDPVTFFTTGYRT